MGMKLKNGAWYKCFYCLRFYPYGVGSKSRRITVDHFYPVSQSGIDNSSNKVLACFRCNAKKGDRPPTLLEMEKFIKYGKNNFYQKPFPGEPPKHQIIN